MSACATGCRCGCGQTGCGCHEQPAPVRRGLRHPVCPGCGAVIVTREVNGRAVSLCPRCDLGHK